VRFRYKGFDRSGKAVSATTDAPDRDQAMESLRREGLYVTDLVEGSSNGGAVGASGRRVGSGRRLKYLVTFVRQMHVLVASGTPLVQALGAVERQAEDEGWRQVIGTIRERVEEGMPLSEAMAAHGQYFDAICRSLTAAGEAGGNMAEMLARLSVLTRKQQHLRNSISGAMVYPCLLIVAGIGVLAVMLLFVLPRFVGLFETLGVALPPTTRFLVATSTVLQAYWWGVLLGASGAGFALRMWLKSEGGWRVVQSMMLRAPKVGQVLKSLVLARVARLLGVLLEGHVGLLDALKLTKQSAGNYRYAELITHAEDAVSRGEAISVAFADVELVTPSVYEAIRNGEQSGKMGSLLLQIADFLDEDNEVIVKSLTSIIEPLILIGLGALVAFIAVSLFMPLFDLTALTGGG